VVPTEGVHLILSPSASPCGFGTSPFKSYRLKGGGKDGGKGQVPSFSLGAHFHANRAPEKVLLAKVFWEEEKTRSAFTVCALRKQCEA